MTAVGEASAPRLALLGVGYMGGSLALAAKRARAVREVIGYDPSAEAIRVALTRGIIDGQAADPVAAVRGADVVVLAGPVRALGPTASAIAASVEPSALVIDIGSVKAPVVRAVEATALADRFVGCHPLAGTEATGPGASVETLYQGKPCFLCPGASAASALVARARAFWEGLGASVLLLDPDVHDVFMAAASHLPHVAAFALAGSLGADVEMLVERIPPSYPPTSLRDSTRVAASNPTIWRDILMENRAHLLPRVRRLEDQVARLRAALESGDASALQALLAEGQAARGRVVP